MLYGSDSALTVRNFIDLITGKPRKGANVSVTINSKAQNAAWNALQAAPAASRARWSRWTRRPARSWPWPRYPSYDPNVLATHNGNQLNAADEALLGRPATRC